MLPASNRAAGTASGFPDTCNTPNGSGVDIPTPYTNLGDHSQAQGYSATVFVTMMNALSQAATVPTTSGDESGTTHPTIKGVMSHTVGNPIVFVNSVPAINVSSATAHNNGNCPVGSVVSPGAANVFYTLGEPASARRWASLGASTPWSHEDLRAREWFLSGPSLERAAGANGAALIVCRFIAEQTVNELFALLAECSETSITLDLRGCPGGTLEGAVALLSALLPAGAPLFETEDEDGDLSVRVAAPGPRLEHRLTLLVDAETGSAAEIVAGSLAAHGRADVLGGPTAGKLTAQSVGLQHGARVLKTRLRVRLP